MKNLFKKIVALGLAATMTLGMAVTSVAADENNEASVVAEVWVNGKDIKANEKKQIEEDLNKTFVKNIADIVKESATIGASAIDDELNVGCSYVTSVTDTTATIAEAFDDKGKGVKSDYAKAAFKKANEKKGIAANVTVTAGKKAGETVRVWIAEYNKKEKVVASYGYFDVVVKEAPKKFDLSVAGVAKKATINVKDTVTLDVTLPEDATASADTTYKWEVKAPKNAAEGSYALTPATDGKSATFTANKMSAIAKADKYAITCTNVQSGKKAKFTVTVANDLVSYAIADQKMESAASEKQTLTLGWSCETDMGLALNVEEKKVDTTDKIKVYVSDDVDTDEAKTWEVDETGKTPKFKLTGDKSKLVTAKFDKKTSQIVLTAKKGTEDGATAQVIVVITHADKSIDVETFTVTVGTAAETPSTAE